MNSAPGTGKSFIFTLIANDGLTALTCTIFDLNKSCQDVTHTETVADGEVVWLDVTTTGSPGGAALGFSFTHTPAGAT
ncbi:MAG TPA: hypothetical protein VGH50_02925, partial [Candidatus Binatia bacterium]